MDQTVGVVTTRSKYRSYATATVSDTRRLNRYVTEILFLCALCGVGQHIDLVSHLIPLSPPRSPFDRSKVRRVRRVSVSDRSAANVLIIVKSAILPATSGSPCLASHCIGQTINAEWLVHLLKARQGFCLALTWRASRARDFAGIIY